MQSARPSESPGFRAQWRAVVATEWGLLRAHAKLRLSALGVLLLPALYALIYLSAVWDPNAHTRALPVGVVSEDIGAQYRGIEVNAGRELVDALQRESLFDFRRYDSADEVRAAVRRRDLLFALIVPADFSEQAVPGGETRRARLIVYTSEGNSYTGAGIARRFAADVASRVNETLNEKRWALVLEADAGSARSLQALRDHLSSLHEGAGGLSRGMHAARDGVAQLRAGQTQAFAGAQRLTTGSVQLADAGSQLTEGLRRGAGQMRQAQARLPGEQDLRALRAGSASLVAGQVAMGDAIGQLGEGAGRLASGLAEVRARSEDSFFVSAELARAAVELETGGQRLSDGLREAGQGQARLLAGARQLDEGVVRLTGGMSALGSGLSGLASALPEERQLDEFTGGLREVARGAQELQAAQRQLGNGLTALDVGMVDLDDGAARLGAGLELIVRSLPAGTQRLGGSASGLAASAQATLDVVAPVANNGTGLAPNFVPMALWVGALMTCFLFHMRRLPRSLQETSRPARWIGKLTVPALLVLGQSLVMMVMMVAILDVRVPDPGVFALTLAITSLGFLAIVLAMVKAWGDIGKVVAALLLILQLSSAGALIPIELTNEFFQRISPWLPFTWVVRAFRASLFGAFEGAWLLPWLELVATACVATLAGIFVGRWKFVADADYGPAIEID